MVAWRQEVGGREERVEGTQRDSRKLVGGDGNGHYLFLAVLGLRCCEWPFSSYGEQGLLCFLQCVSYSFWWLLLLKCMGSRGWAQWHVGLVAPWHMRSSQTRD